MVGVNQLGRRVVQGLLELNCSEKGGQEDLQSFEKGMLINVQNSLCGRETIHVKSSRKHCHWNKFI